MTRAPSRAMLGERGAVAAEFAVALPALVLVVLLCMGMLGAAAVRVRLQDAAADAARLAARGESSERVAGVVASAGGTASVTERGDLVCVTASSPAPAPLPPVVVSSCALAGGW